jgi:ubiquinone/menaquinone biosynthesis C-methylase UbiE
MTEQETIKHHLEPLHPKKILDLSTGKGYFIEFLKENLGGFDELVGVDPNEKSLEKARKAHPDKNISFMPMRAQKLEFPDASFDMVTISRALHHLTHLPHCFKEIHRVLKDDGLFVINEMYSDLKNEAQLTAVEMHHLRVEIDHLLGVDHFYTFTKEELVEMPDNAKFHTMEILDYHPLDKKNTEELIQEYTQELESLKGHPQYKSLKEKLEKVVQKVKTSGTDTPRHMLIICRKK